MTTIMIGKTLSHFKIISLIAEGGMGIVYRAEDLHLSRQVAIKVLRPSLVADPDRRQRFVTEARTAAAVTHPGIATIHEIGEVEGIIFIAMELVEGESLASLIGRGGLSSRRALELGLEIAEAIAAAHAAGVVHRDLKPENILISTAGHACILDFGLAGFLEDSDHNEISALAPTGPLPGSGDPYGSILGTPAYMSPEQARGKNRDFRTDIFSFGSTFYEMCTGRAPFKGGSSSDTISNILSREPLPVTGLNPDLPSSVQWILDKCLEKDADLRYQDTRDLVGDLRRLIHPDGSSTSVEISRTGAERGRRQSRPGGILPLLLALILLVVVLTSWFLFNRRQPDPPVTREPVAGSLAVFTFENLKDHDDPERLGQIFQELLITDLSGQPGLKIFSSQRLHDVNKQLGGEGGEEWDNSFATEVAARVGAETMLTGSMSQLGERWILTWQLVDVADGTVIQSQRLDGDDLYTLVDDLTANLANDLGLTQPMEIATRTPVREKTSASIVAYRHYLEGVELLNMSRFDDAISKLEKAIEIDPAFVEALYKLAIAKWWSGDNIESARRPLTRVLAGGLYPSDKMRLMTEGAMALVGYRYVESVNAFQSLTATYPEEKEAWYGLGEALFHYPGGGRITEAEPAFEQAVALDPDFLLPYRHIFDIYRMGRRYQEAVDRAQSLVDRDPTDPLWHRYLLGAVAIMGDAAETARVLDTAFEFNRKSEDRRDLYKCLAMVARELGDPVLTEQHLRQALEIDPGNDDQEILAGLVEILWADAEYDEVEQLALEQLATEPRSMYWNDRLLKLRGIRGEFREALTMARDLVDRYPDDPLWYRYWITFAVIVGDREGSDQAVVMATDHNLSSDDLREIHSSAGRAAREVGDYNRARRFFERAQELLPEGPLKSLQLEQAGNALLQGRLDEAQGYLDGVGDDDHSNFYLPNGRFRLAIERHDHEEAYRQFQARTETLPPGKVNPYLMAGVHLIMDQMTAGQELFEQGMRDLTREEQRWSLLVGRPFGVAWAYLIRGDYEKAESLFQLVAESRLNAVRGLSQEGRGWCRLCTGDLIAAERFFREADAASQVAGSARIGLAITLISSEDYIGGELVLRQILGEGFNHALINNLLGHLFASQGRFREALPWAEQSLAMDSSRASYELLAWILIAGELDIQRGIDLARQSRQIHLGCTDLFERLPHRKSPEHSLGLASLKQGRFQEAVDYLEAASQLAPDPGSVKGDLERARIIRGGIRLH